MISCHPSSPGVRSMRSHHVMAAAAVLLTAACLPIQQTATPPCESRVIKGEVPLWARAGFSPGAEAPYASSRRGDMLAVLFGYPLHSPPLPDRGNKILWRSKVPVTPSEPLLIEARLNGVGEPTRITIEHGPGPSAVDLPEPGCWRLNLTWSSHTDSIDLEYSAG